MMVACMHYCLHHMDYTCTSFLQRASALPPQYGTPVLPSSSGSNNSNSKAWTRKSSSQRPVFVPSHFQSASLHNDCVALHGPARKTRPVNAILVAEKKCRWALQCSQIRFRFRVSSSLPPPGKREACWKHKWQGFPTFVTRPSKRR